MPCRQLFKTKGGRGALGFELRKILESSAEKWKVRPCLNNRGEGEYVDIKIKRNQMQY